MKMRRARVIKAWQGRPLKVFFVRSMTHSMFGAVRIAVGDRITISGVTMRLGAIKAKRARGVRG